jgi:hypothetical protein
MMPVSFFLWGNAFAGADLPPSDAGREAEISTQVYLPWVGAYRPDGSCSPFGEVVATDTDLYGGQEAVPGNWPCMVAIVRAKVKPYDGQFCGGSLIAARWVLTAAHCVADTSPAGIEVVLGMHWLASGGQERLPVQQILLHPSYDTDTNEADLALLFLARPSTVRTVTLIDAYDMVLDRAGRAGSLIGWGLSEDGYPSGLREVQVPIVANSTCNANWFGLVSDTMLCAGNYLPSYVGACYGDSGGPLLVLNSDKSGWVLSGVVSWGSASCQRHYGVFTRVSNFRDWIQETVCARDSEARLCTGDAYEPDSTAEQAKKIIVNSPPQRRSFHQPKDEDWVKFQTKANSWYVIETRNLGHNSDTLLSLIDTNQVTQLAEDDDAGVGVASRLVWQAPKAALYYVRIRHYQPRFYGAGTRYELLIWESTPQEAAQLLQPDEDESSAGEAASIEKDAPKAPVPE